MKVYIKRKIDSDSFIKECLRDYLNLSENVEIIIIRDSYGKPFFRDYNINFSLSHSGEYIAVVLSSSRVGIDIEEIKKRDYIKIAERYFCVEELKAIKEKGEKYFYTLWTIKEAFSKLLGKNITNGMKSKDLIEGEGYIIHQINAPEGYIITIICDTEEKIIIA